ncbi:MAG: xyloglucanase precursor [Imperialibacter sp.]
MAFLLLFTSSLSIGQALDMELLKGIKPRNIGPAGMSGRVTAADVVQSNPDIIYLGTASGGLWKSTGGGTSWTPIFTKEKAASIGSIAIYQKSPDIIWVGTGEGNPRNSQSMGNGVYRSLDAGQTWQHMGLENTRTIHRIFVHPDDPNTVWVGAQGNAWADSPDRGVFKTTDGGKTWKKVLFVNNRTGIADLTIDPTNPNKLIAGMWEYRRWPWFFKSGGEGSGIYVSVDGGENWTKRTSDDGLPEGEIGKTAIAIAPSNPNVVYALVETKKNALYKSVDGGKKWNKVQDQDVGDRPFYYWDLRVDPKNENTLYNVYGIVKVSIDGGKTFETLAGGDKVHVDHHMFYVLPTDASLMLDGNDGGAYISRDRGKTWRFVENLPVGQFYHVNVDMDTP